MASAAAKTSLPDNIDIVVIVQSTATALMIHGG